MFARLSTVAIVCTILAAPGRAEPPAAPPAAPARTLRHTGVVNASIDDLWKAWTTADGWVAAVGVAKADVDFRLGGRIRTHDDPQGTIGDDGTITNTVIAYEPERMIAFKSTAPTNAPDSVKHFCANGFSVLRFDPLAPTRTRLTITQMGCGDDPLDDEAYAFFDRGNAWTLKKIQDHFAPAHDEQAVAAAEQALHRLVGEWSFSDIRPDGGTFRGETGIVELFGGKVLFATGYLGDEKDLFHHSHFLAARDPRSGTIRVWNFNEHGNYTEGEARLEGKDLVLDWHTWSAGDGAFIPYRVVYTFDGADAYDLEVSKPADDEPDRMERLVKVRYTRAKNAQGTASSVGDAPAASATR